MGSGSGRDDVRSGGPEWLLFAAELDVPDFSVLEVSLASAGHRPPDAARGGYAWADATDPDAAPHVIAIDQQGLVAEAARIPLGGPVLCLKAGAPAWRQTLATQFPDAWIELDGARHPVEAVVDHASGWIGFAVDLANVALAVSVRYFFDQGGPAGLGALRYPVIRVGAPRTERLVGAFHPGRPLDPRGGLTFAESGSVYRTNLRTTLGQVITITSIGDRSGIGYQWDPQAALFYAVPKGDWQLGVESGSVGEADLSLLFGLSGLEFGRVGATGILRFVANAPAFALGFAGAGAGATGPAGARSMTSNCPGSDYPVTTSWLYPIETVAGPTMGLPRGYYSQPQASGLYSPGLTGSFLDVFSPPLGQFAPPADRQPGGATGVLGAPEASFPVAPYAGVDVGPSGSQPAEVYSQFENQLLAPTRFAAIADINFNAQDPGGLAPLGATLPSGITEPSGPVVNAVTARGLLSVFSKDRTKWESLNLAQTTSNEAGFQELMLTEIDATLRTALLESQLFLVISDPEALQKHASTPYRVSQAVLDVFRSPYGATPALLAKVALLRPPGLYTGRTYFEVDARTALGADFDAPIPTNPRLATPPDLTWGQLLLREAAVAQLTVNGWTFDLSPTRWADEDGVEQTIFILKFTDRSLGEVIEDLGAWTLPNLFNKDPARTQARLRQIVQDAREALGRGETEFANFVQNVVDSGATGDNSPPWNGTLFLNAFVPTSQLPPDLEGLAAGISSPDFRAHHFGVDLSPFSVGQGRIWLGDSAVFGLIFYLDPADLVFSGQAYDFKVLSLKILFANSEIVSFASQVELLITQLFGETATLVGGERGNNIVLNGSWQKHGGADSYSFTQQGRSPFAITSKVLDTVVVTKAQFVTEKPHAGSPSSVDVTSRFLLWGAMGFQALKGFDLFSFGPSGAGDRTGTSQLAFSNMFVAMHFDRYEPTDRTFSFEAGQMSFDASASSARPGGLARRFPLSVSRMLQNTPQAVAGPSGATAPPPPAKTATPAQLGYLPVSTPLASGSLGPEWYGLDMSLNLGSRGALAGQAAFTASLLAAWAPSQNAYNVAVGLRLPGSDGRSIQIAGPLGLDIGKIEMMLNPADDSYLMRFRNISLGFLGLKFPPGGRSNVLLFGDPDPRSNSSALGWYAAYKKDADKSKDKGGGAVETLVLLDQGDRA